MIKEKGHKMKRKIIKIDEELCNGCGNCVIGCSEGALAIIDDKARLVKENFCDGFGDCIGTCPTGALTIEEREAALFDEDGVKDHLRENFGDEALARMEKAMRRHSQETPHVCPGMKMRVKEEKQENTSEPCPSELGHWPVQLHLVSPQAPFFKNRELVVLSTCSPVASAQIHQKYLRGRSVVVACPKLDNTGPYASKLSKILAEPSIPKVIVVRMEVPCCAGLTMITEEALRNSGRDDIGFEEHVISLDGDLIETRKIDMDSNGKSSESNELLKGR